MKKIIILLIVCFSVIAIWADDIEQIKNSDWYGKAMKNIEESEYYIKYDESSNVYQSPNRANSLRFYYYDDGFKVTPRENSNSWDIEMRLESYGRDKQTKYYGISTETEKNKMTVSGKGLDIEYINNKKGMRQNFIVSERPEGNGPLELSLVIEGKNTYQITPDKITFKSSNETVMEYKDLHVYDSDNNELDGRFIKTDNGFKILISDKDAKYPITVDPLSTTPDWIGEGNQVSARYGFSVSTAGDVNGDGYSDIIVGTLYYDNGELDEGAAFVYYGSATGLSTTYDWTQEGNQVDARYGFSVSTAGDVNGDGFSDIIVGAYHYDNGETDEGAAFVYHGSAAGLSTTHAWIGEGNQADALYGYSVSTAGDVNGDGFSDVIVGAMTYDNLQADEGTAFVYYGSATGLSTTLAWMGEGNQTYAYYGVSVSSAGDVNGDGYSDVIVGAYSYDNGENGEGAAFVYHGSAAGLSTTHAWMGESNQASAYYGANVSSAGDVNGDGYSDIIIGAPYYDNGETNEGASFVYYGSLAGLSTTYDWIGESNQASAYYGYSVSTAGDVNGDGYSDVIVGAYYYDNGETNEGAAFAYHGGPTGLSITYDWMGEGNQGSVYYGRDVSSAGDVDGDGYSDIIIGAPYYDNGETDEGAAFVYYGGPNDLSTTHDWMRESNQASADYATVSTAGDVNGDGYSDVIVGARRYDNGELDEGAAFVYYGSETGLSTTYDWIGESNQASAYYGYSVSTAGDVNGDGYSDVIVGAYFYTNGQTNEGAAFVYYGSATGLSTTYDWMGESNQANAYYGWSLSTAGDANGDGYSDVIVGAYRFDNGQTDEGVAFVYYGGATGLSTTHDWMGECNQAYAYYGRSVSTAGDVNGDGYSDVIVGALIYDNGQSDEGAAFLYYGGATGLSATYDWMGECNQVEASYGISVSTAGDINGDGYSDIIVGAYRYDNGQTNEGAAFLYYGIATGLSPTPDWIGESNQASAYYGYSVSTAGDVNGDGYSDVIIGAYYYDNGETDEGAAFVYYGSATGLSTIYNWYDWMGESNQAGAWYGYSVSSAGDVNGDGYSDAIVGAMYYDNGQTNEGAAFVYYGNSDGISVKPQQMRSDESSLIVAPLYSQYESRFKISLIGRNFIGRDKIKLQWETKPLGTPFDGIGLNESAYWLDTGTNGIERVEYVSGLSNDTYYKWRVRVKYDMVKGMPERYSRWYYISDNAPTEVDLKTGSTVMINQINIGSMIIDNGIKLFVTGNGDRYRVDKLKSDKYTVLGDMENGEYIDNQPIEGLNEYRINEFTNSKITNRAEISIYYTQIKTINTEGFYTNIEKLNTQIKKEGLKIYDINGRKINEIQNPGSYYLIKESADNNIEKEKVIIIY